VEIELEVRNLLQVLHQRVRGHMDIGHLPAHGTNVIKWH